MLETLGVIVLFVAVVWVIVRLANIRATFGKMVNIASDAAAAPTIIDPTPAMLAIAGDSMNKNRIREAILSGWMSAVEKAVHDHPVPPEQQQQFLAFANRYAFTEPELNSKGSLTRLSMGRVLFEVMHGKIPPLNLGGPVPFNLQKNEIIVWVFSGVQFWE